MLQDILKTLKLKKNDHTQTQGHHLKDKIVVVCKPSNHGLYFSSCAVPLLYTETKNVHPLTRLAGLLSPEDVF